MELLSREFYSIQSWLLPDLVEELGELTKKQCELTIKKKTSYILQEALIIENIADFVVFKH
jgi:hypothetical protein